MRLEEKVGGRVQEKGVDGRHKKGKKTEKMEGFQYSHCNSGRRKCELHCESSVRKNTLIKRKAKMDDGGKNYDCGARISQRS